MSTIPPFEIGMWNAWIIILFLFLSYIPGQLINKEALKKVTEGFAIEQWSRMNRFLAKSTHVVIIPIIIIYSVFLPLKLGSVWLYAGLPLCFIGLGINLIAGINIATASLDEKPITRGAYAFSRHPVYLSGFLLFLGIGMTSASWIVILFALVWIIIWTMVVPSEERFLLEKYGDAYREYMNKTPRWLCIPKPGNR